MTDYYDRYIDAYHSPAKLGLEVVAEVELSEPNYSFDIAMVWYHFERDAFYAARDTGCSCPSPFEDYTSLDVLTGPLTKHEAADWLKELLSPDLPTYYYPAKAVPNIVAGIEKVVGYRR